MSAGEGGLCDSASWNSRAFVVPPLGLDRGGAGLSQNKRAGPGSWDACAGAGRPCAVSPSGQLLLLALKKPAVPCAIPNGDTHVVRKELRGHPKETEPHYPTNHQELNAAHECARAWKRVLPGAGSQGVASGLLAPGNAENKRCAVQAAQRGDVVTQQQMIM